MMTEKTYSKGYPARFEFWYSHIQKKMTQLQKKSDMSRCDCDVDYCCPLCSSIQEQAVEYADAQLKKYGVPPWWKCLLPKRLTRPGTNPIIYKWLGLGVSWESQKSWWAVHLNHKWFYFNDKR